MGCAEASMASIKMNALKSHALLCRRSRRYDDAAAYWCQLLDVPACPSHLAREASEALAIHHEHRARDLPAARAFALRSLDAHMPAWNQAVLYRLARIEKKINKSEVSSLKFEDAGTLRLET